MNIKVNMIYSVLAEAAGIKDTNRLRKTWHAPSVDKSLVKLLRSSSGDPSANVESLLKLMSASPMWFKLIDELDKTNTYDIEVSPAGKAGITFNDMLNWAKSRPIDRDNPVSSACAVDDPPITLVLDRLLTTMWRSLSDA